MVLSRTKNIGVNVSLNFIFKLIGGLLSFVIIPMTLNYLSNEKYGIWVTILSFVSWFTFFDMGLGNGLRNKLAEFVSKNDIKTARKYISTGYFMMAAIASVICIILIIVYPFINWQVVFNARDIQNSELLVAMLIITILFIFNFMFSLCNSIFYAYQKPALVGLGSVLFQSIFILSIMLLRRNTQGQLQLFSLLYGSSMIISNLILSVFFFKNHTEVIPSIKFVNKAIISDIMNLGIKFFIIQIAGLIVLTTDNIIITQFLGPTYVTEYNIVYKLFSIITMVHGGIFLNSLWSSYTEAYEKKDFKWINDIFKKTIIIFILVSVSIIFIAVINRPLINIWVGKNQQISSTLVLFIAIYTIIVAWNGTYCSLLNGLGKINLQMYISIYSGIVNIPLSIVLLKNFNLGSSGVILATILSILPSSIILPIQAKRIIKGFEQKIQ